MSLSGKRVLITAGPTWVPIDSVRVISNTATGETGILLAENLVKAGAKVTLLLGPAQVCCLSNSVKLKRFIFFDDLQRLLSKELSERDYDIVIHSAAVSDYKPSKQYQAKIRSGKQSLSLNLIPTPKLINQIKAIDSSLFLVGFKFEPNSAKMKLIKEANGLIRQSHADLVVANTFNKKSYNAYVVSRKSTSRPLKSKKELVKELLQEIGDAICRKQN